MPCRTVGGDFYDYVDVSDTEFGFALGDVAGKGPPAAMLAAVVQSNFGALAPVTREPAEMMLRLNQALLRRQIDARFATMCYGVARPSGEFSYCNAGQEPPLVISKDGIRWLETGGPVLGLLPMARYEYETVTLAPGDLVIVCSDGVTEARSVTNEEFGRDRMLEAVKSDARRQAGHRPRPAALGRQPVRPRRSPGRRHHGAGVPLRGTARRSARAVPSVPVRISLRGDFSRTALQTWNPCISATLTGLLHAI